MNRRTLFLIVIIMLAALARPILRGGTPLLPVDPIR